MRKKTYLFAAVVVGFLFIPFLAFAQDAERSTDNHKLMDFVWSFTPFLVLGILFWFFFVRVIKKEQKSPLVLRHQAYQERHMQHMQRIEQLLERIAVALEKDKP